MSFTTQSLSYKAPEGRSLLDDISLSFEPSKLHIVLGPNGAGKSTLLNLLSGFIEPSGGTIELNEISISEQSALQLAFARAVLPQSEPVPASLQAEEIIALGRYPHQQAEKKGLIPKTSPEAHQALIDDAVKRVDIEHLRARSFSQLSGGEKQRVQIARVLAQDTNVLLLDEPTSALDIAHQHQLLRLLSDLKDEGKTVVVVLHDINLALRYADSIVLLHQGKLLAHGSPEAVITPENMAQVYGVQAEIFHQTSINSAQLIIQQ